MAAGLLLARLIVGLAMAAHGAQKLSHLFGGHGLKGTGAFFETMGFRPGTLFAFLAGAGELGSGLLIALGFLGPAGPALLVLVMVVAALTAHFKKGFFAQNGGFELNAIYIAAAITLAFAGPGAYSLDSALGIGHYFTQGHIWTALGIGALLGLLTFAARRAPAPQQQSAA